MSVPGWYPQIRNYGTDAERLPSCCGSKGRLRQAYRSLRTESDGKKSQQCQTAVSAPLHRRSTQILSPNPIVMSIAAEFLELSKTRMHCNAVVMCKNQNYVTSATPVASLRVGSAR